MSVEVQKEAIGYSLAVFEATVMQRLYSYEQNGEKANEWEETSKFLESQFETLQDQNLAYECMAGIAYAYFVQFCAATGSRPTAILETLKDRWVKVTEKLDEVPDVD